MPDLVMCPQNTLEIALGVKHPFGQGQVSHRHYFPHNKCRCMILVFIIGFSDMPDLMVWLEMTLRCGKNPIWPTFA